MSKRLNQLALHATHRQRLADGPAREAQRGDDADGNLDRRAKRHGEREVEAVLGRHPHRRDVLGGVADNRQQNRALSRSVSG